MTRVSVTKATTRIGPLRPRGRFSHLGRLLQSLTMTRTRNAFRTPHSNKIQCAPRSCPDFYLSVPLLQKFIIHGFRSIGASRRLVISAGLGQGQVNTRGSSLKQTSVCLLIYRAHLSQRDSLNRKHSSLAAPIHILLFITSDALRSPKRSQSPPFRRILLCWSEVVFCHDLSCVPAAH